MALSLTINGEVKNFEQSAFPASLLELITNFGINPEMVVAEVNGQIVKRPLFPDQTLADGDVIELVRFVGGG